MQENIKMKPISAGTEAGFKVKGVNWNHNSFCNNRPDSIIIPQKRQKIKRLYRRIM